MLLNWAFGADPGMYLSRKDPENLPPWAVGLEPAHCILGGKKTVNVVLLLTTEFDCFLNKTWVDFYHVNFVYFPKTLRILYT